MASAGAASGQLQKYRGLRGWLDTVDKLGELERVSGADWDVEMGAVTHMLTEKSRGQAPAILFDDVPGYANGYRTLYGQLSSIKRIALTLGLPLDYECKVDIVQRYHARMQDLKPRPPRFVNDGPIFENVIEGDAIDVLKFPVPRHHEADKARFIGTACCVMTKDPDAGWFNLGAYRSQVYDGKTVGCQITEGKHGRNHRDKYFARGEPPGPAAVHVVVEPAAGIERARYCRRVARRAGRRGARTLHRIPDPGRLRNRHRRRDRVRPDQAGRAVRRMDGLLLRRHPGPALRQRQNHPAPQRSDPDLRAAA